MIQACEIVHENIVLWTVTDFVSIEIHIIFVINRNHTSCFRNNTANHLHRGCFTRSIMAQQNGDLVFDHIHR